MPTATSEASRCGEEPPDQRQTGLCSMQRPVILLSGLPPDLPDGFIRRPYRPSDRPALPTALPEALAGRVTWVILTAHLTGRFRQPDFPTARPPDLPDGFIRQHYRPSDRPARPAASPLDRPPDQQPDRHPNRPARPTSPTGHPHQPSTPTIPDQPSTPAKVPPACLTGRLRSAGRRLRGWR